MGRASGINVIHVRLDLLLLAHSLANAHTWQAPGQLISLNKEHFLLVIISLVLLFLTLRKAVMVERPGLPSILSLVSSTKMKASSGPPLLRLLITSTVAVRPAKQHPSKAQLLIVTLTPNLCQQWSLPTQ